MSKKLKLSEIPMEESSDDGIDEKPESVSVDDLIGSNGQMSQSQTRKNQKTHSIRSITRESTNN